MKKIALMFYLLILISFISWIITILGTSFTHFPADALYYSKSLPPSYWFGVTLAIIAVMMSIFKPITKRTMRLLPLILLLLFLNGLPAFTYENMQFCDTYQHASSALQVYHSGGLQVMDAYAKEYPGAFSLLAQILQFQKGDPLFLMGFLRFYSLLTPILSLILVYIVSDKFSPKYSPLACFVFLSVNWVEYTHFSPQAYAFILYLIFWFVFMKVLINQERSRSWLIVLFLSLFAIIISHPTTSLFLFLSLASALYITLMIFRSRSLQVKELLQRNRRCVILILLVSWISWLFFMGGDFMFGYVLPMAIQSIKSFGQLQQLSVPPNPEMTYFISSILRVVITLYVALAGFVILIFLNYRKKIKASVLLLAGVFLSVFFAIPPFLFWGKAAVLPRILLFSVFPWSVLIAIYMDSTSVRRLSKILILTSIAIFALLIPISKYGAEPFTYIPSSISSSAVFITERSQSQFLILLKPALEGPPSHVYNFYESLYDKNVQILSYRKEFSVSVLEGNISDAIQMIEPNVPVIFTTPYEKALLLRRNSSSLIKDIEEAVGHSFSLIYDSGSARIYR